MPSPVSRRDFLASAGAAAMAPLVLPRHLALGGARAPSATLNVACVGIGGMGMNNMAELMGENIVAVCDVDFPLVERSLASRLRPRDGVVSPVATRLQEAYAKTAKFADFRVMLEQQRDIDAVMIATPDHTHAVIAQAAMELGKHVYVQKPLTWSVYEARLLARTAAANRVVTQMGNQGHSMEGSRRIVEIVRSGILGPIREAHVWTDRPVRYWAQGIPRPPREAPAVAAQDPNNPPRWNMGTVERAVIAAMAANPQSPPPGLDWNLFLGPAQEIPYHPSYHPFSWRGWVDFGGGALGDMGAHLVDQTYWALELTQPTAITTSSSPWGGPADNPATFPLAVMVEYEYPARGAAPPLRLFWYDGGLMPPRPPFLPDDVALPRGDGGGGVMIGDRGILTYETYGNRPEVYPESVAAEAEAVAKTVVRVSGTHEANWAAACKGEVEVSCPFSYAAPLTETMLLGMAALRAGAGKKVLYDSAAMRFTNDDKANAALTREYPARMENLMRATTMLGLTLLLVAPVASQQAPNTLTEAERAEGWALLFDGQTTAGWRNYRTDTLSGGWQVVDGALTRARRGGDIITREQFANFELVLEWRLSADGPAGNSGIFYRATEEPMVIYMGAAEMQILDNARHPDGRNELTSSGSNYALHGVPHRYTRPVGQWNEIRLRAEGNHIQQWLNGNKVADFEIDGPDWTARVAASKFKDWPLYARARSGHIGLQEHGSVVAFRNIKIKRLP